MDRISRPTLYILMASLLSLRSTCERGHVGAVITKGGRVVATGYNGAPSRQPHCTEVGCEIVNDGCERCIHAEVNAIAWAARDGISLYGSELYTTSAPCYACAKLIINAGVRGVCYLTKYRDDRGLKLLQSANILVEWYPDVVDREEYEAYVGKKLGTIMAETQKS